MVRTIRPSRPMLTKALGAKVSSAPASASTIASGRRRLSTKPPPAAAPVFRKPRLERASAAVISFRAEALEACRSMTIIASLSAGRGLLDCFVNADIGPAAADVAGHRIVDFGISRMRVARKECRGRHDLARLAVPALWHLMIDPGLLDPGARRGRADSFDRRDRRTADAVHRGDA